MFATGVVSAHTGVPLHKVWEKRAEIKNAFEATIRIQKETTLNLVSVGWCCLCNNSCMNASG